MQKQRTEGAERKLARFEETWTETLWCINAVIAETEVIRYTRPDDTAVWVTAVVLAVVPPLNDFHHLVAHGLTETGQSVTDEFLDGIHEFPEELAALVPELIESATGLTGNSPLTSG